MELILAPAELKSQINLLRNYINDSMQHYLDAKDIMQDYISDDQLLAASWKASKEKMDICYSAIMSGALAAQDSINRDLDTLEGSIGNEYLHGGIIQSQIDAYRAHCQIYQKAIDDAKATLENTGSSNGSIDVTGLILGFEIRIMDLKAKIAVLQGKLDFLDNVNQATANLFESALSMLSAVAAAISDGDIVVRGGGDYSDGSWLYTITNDPKRELAIDKLTDHLQKELGLSLEDLQECFGENSVDMILVYMVTLNAYNFRYNSEAELIAKVLTVLSGSLITLEDGNYVFQKKDGTVIRCKKDKVKDYITSNRELWDTLQTEGQAFAKPGSRYDLLPSEKQALNAIYIYDFLHEQGWSMEAICGMLGNVQQEGIMNPGTWQDKEDPATGVGLCQWSGHEKFLQILDNNEETWMDSADKFAVEHPRELMDLELV